MAAKCNITTSVLETIQPLLYGVNCLTSKDEAILENYIEFLKCPTVDIAICHPDGCDQDDTVVVNLCSGFAITGFDMTIVTHPGDDNTYYQFQLNNHYINSPNLFAFDWTVDENVFDIVSEMPNMPGTLVLKLKAGVDVGIVSVITLLVKNQYGCTSETSCTFANGSLNCGDYDECPNPKNLVVTEYNPVGANLIFTWNREGGDVINLVTMLNGSYTLIDWGDGTVNTSMTHTYMTSGSFTFKMYNSNTTVLEIRSSIPSVYHVTSVAALPNTINIKLGLDVNDITSLPSLAAITGLPNIIVARNSLATFPSIASNTLLIGVNVSYNHLPVPTINALLIALDNHGLLNGTFIGDGQDFPSPPSGPGITAKNNLISKGWTVITD